MKQSDDWKEGGKCNLEGGELLYQSTRANSDTKERYVFVSKMVISVLYRTVHLNYYSIINTVAKGFNRVKGIVHPK